MIPISYTITPTITENLRQTDQFRRHILLTALSPIDEAKLRWNAVMTRTYSSLKLAGLPVTKTEITQAFLTTKRLPSATYQSAWTYRETLDLIRREWTASPRIITVATVEQFLTDFRSVLPMRRRSLTGSDEVSVKNILAYNDTQKDHPVILSGIIYGQLMQTDMGRDTAGIVPRLVTALELTKYGYDCRGLAAPEPIWLERMENHTKALASIATYAALTVWLEHYTNTLRDMFERLSASVSELSQQTASETPGDIWTLNPREDRILTVLEAPTAKITNRQVQQMCRISQVTASRDLTHLTSLGLLYSHGKGRSVYYTRI